MGFNLSHFVVMWFISIAMFGCLSESKCQFEAIFNFGDSNSDTGGFWAAFPAESGPFGMTYFKKPTGRATDGRLVIDFFAQALGMPFLSPYLQSIGSDYRHGANFATLASTVLLPNTSLFVSGLSPFALAIQLNQMKEFKAKVDGQKLAGKDKRLPSPDIFGKSLYTIYIGQNDFTSRFELVGTEEGKQYYNDVIWTIVWTIKELYALGGRSFMVLNLAPVGCYPSFLAGQIHNTSNLDKFGCVISYSKAVMNYNAMLNDILNQTRASIPDASLIIADTHKVILDLIRRPRRHGFKHSTRACCGHGGGLLNFDTQVYCGNTKLINGKNVTATACKDPHHYVSWDGIHTTEAANKRITRALLKGSLYDPPFPLHKLCHLHHI